MESLFLLGLVGTVRPKNKIPGKHGCIPKNAMDQGRLASHNRTDLRRVVGIFLSRPLLFDTGPGRKEALQAMVMKPTSPTSERQQTRYPLHGSELIRHPGIEIFRVSAGCILIVAANLAERLSPLEDLVRACRELCEENTISHMRHIPPKTNR